MKTETQHIIMTNSHMRLWDFVNEPSERIQRWKWIKLLIRYNLWNIFWKIDTNGCTALHYAVTLGHADATYLLLDLGADPNRQDRKGRTPAHCGCAKGQFETVSKQYTQYW